MAARYPSGEKGPPSKIRKTQTKKDKVSDKGEKGPPSEISKTQKKDKASDIDERPRSRTYGEKGLPSKIRKTQRKKDKASDMDEPVPSSISEKGPPSEVRKSRRKKDKASDKDEPDFITWERIREELRKFKEIYYGYTELSEEYGFFSDLKISQNSRVYRGKQQNVVGGRRDVVIKLINDNERNRREARRLHELDFHPNVVPILQYGIYTPDIGSYLYLAMEKCREQNLKIYMDRLRENEIQLKEDQKLAVAKQFLRGLKFLHRNSIINGNIKLENVLISKDGNYIKICSFGFKRSLDQDSSIANQSREPEDTSGSGAPETYAKNVLFKEADVFSAGLLVYSIVSDGQHAYGNDPDRWISNIRDNTNRDLSNISITDQKGMEKLLNHMLKDAPEDRPSVEMTLENNIFQKATTDLYLPEDVSRLVAKSQPSETKEERLEDEFEEKIIPAFPKIEAFRKFARSRKGLSLDDEAIQLITEDHADSVETQKTCILRKWQEKLGSEATVQKIRSILAEYQKPKPESERLQDTFQDQVIQAYAKMEDFSEFARSKRGLCLDEHDVQHIKEDNFSSVKEQKMQMLMKWKELNGSEATVEKIQSILAEYQIFKLELEARASTSTTLPSRGRQSQNQQSEQLEQLKQVFEEVTKPYTAIEDLKGFAKSKSGLGLPDSGFHRIASFEGQKLQMLELWIEMLGSEATVRNLRLSANKYAAEKNFIHLPNGMFGMYKDKILREQCYVYRGAEKMDSGDQPCAVKLLRHKKDKAEAEMLVQMEQHENVVKFLHVGEYHGGLSLTTFVVMELCSTRHLGDVIKAKEFKECTAISWALQIVRALVFIHDNNIVHLDIKPQNILFTQDEKSIKLADFDSSKKIQDESGLVENPRDVGTEGYLAPEMYDHDKISPKVDIFAAGVTLAEVFSHGIHPYGKDRFLWTSNIKRNEGLDLSHLRIADKAIAEKLLVRMLDPQYEERPTASVVLADALFQK